MIVGLESHRDLYQPHEWQRLLKTTALYAQSLETRLCGGHHKITRTGEEILRVTLSRIQSGHDGYTFKDGDILFYHYLCRCCRKTVLALRRETSPPVAETPLEQEDADTPEVLTEAAAVAFLNRRQGHDSFVAFLKDKKLKGKLRAYSTGFPKYAADGSDVERIAKDLRVTPATIATYRSRLRELLEEFEIARARRQSIAP